MPHPLLIAARIVPYGGGRAQGPVAADDIGLNLVAGTTASFNILANDQRVDDAQVTLGTLTGPIVSGSPTVSGTQLQVTATSGTGAWSQAYQVQTPFGVSSAVASGTVQPAPTSASIVYQWELNDGFLTAQIPATDGISGSVAPAGSGVVTFNQPTIPTSASGKGVAMNGSGHIEIPDPGSVAVPGVFQKAAFGVSFYAQVGALATVGTASQLVHKDATFQLGGLAIEYANVSGVNRLDPYLRDANGVARRFAAPVGTERNLGINQSFLVAFTCDPALAAGSRCKLYLRRQGEAATVLDTPVATSLTDESAIIGLVQNAVDWVLGAYNASTGGMTGALQRVMFWDGAPSPTQLKALPTSNNITITYPQPVPPPVAGDFTGRDIASGATSFTLDPTLSPSQNASSAIVSIVSIVPTGKVTATVGTNNKTVTITRVTGQTGSYTVNYRLTVTGQPTDDGAISGNVVAVSTGYTPVAFVTTSNPAISHANITARPTFTPSNPLQTSFIDPMSLTGIGPGTRIVRIGGSNGETVYTWRNNTQANSGAVFPKRALVPENLGNTYKVWNANSTLLMIDRRFTASSGEPSNGCSSYLVDVTGQYLGNTVPWRIIRASTSAAVGDGIPGNTWWAWDPLNPLRAYAFDGSGRVFEWFPVGTATESVGAFRQIWGANADGYTNFLGSGHRPHKVNNTGQYVMMGCQNPSGIRGGLRRNLSTGAWGSFCSSLTARPHIPNWAGIDPDDDSFKDTPGRCADGLSWFGTYTMFSSQDQFCFLNAATGAYVGDTPTNFGHHDWTLVDNVEYCSGPKPTGYRMWRLAASNDAPNRGSFPAGNPAHASCRNILDTFETYGATGGSSSGQRYAIFSRAGFQDGEPPSILGVRLGANDFNVVRFICHHRCQKVGDNATEEHCTVSPNARYVAFNSNWKYANSGLNDDAHAYVAILPDGWYSPNNNGS